MGLDDEHAALQARCERLERELADLHEQDTGYEHWRRVCTRLTDDNTRLRAALARFVEEIDKPFASKLGAAAYQAYLDCKLAITEPPMEKGA